MFHKDIYYSTYAFKLAGLELQAPGCGGTPKVFLFANGQIYSDFKLLIKVLRTDVGRDSFAGNGRYVRFHASKNYI